jgi:hypothetical protein
MKIKASEELFNHWKELGNKISMLGNVVQNDMDVSSLQMIEWATLVMKLEFEYNKLRNDTINYIAGEGER